jgi:hypothetical protein
MDYIRYTNASLGQALSWLKYLFLNERRCLHGRLYNIMNICSKERIRLRSYHLQRKCHAKYLPHRIIIPNLTKYENESSHRSQVLDLSSREIQDEPTLREVTAAAADMMPWKRGAVCRHSWSTNLQTTSIEDFFWITFFASNLYCPEVYLISFTKKKEYKGQLTEFSPTIPISHTLTLQAEKITSTSRVTASPLMT